MRTLRVDPIGHAEGRVTPPGSKSISNRALLMAALSEGTTRISGLLRAEDTDRMLESLGRLGASVRVEGTDCEVESQFPFAERRADLFIGNAGTATRMLTAALAFSEGEYGIDGVERMRERPIGDLVDALRSMGADIDYVGKTGYPPLRLHSAVCSSDRVRVRGNVSSQFLTALLVMAPVWAKRNGRMFTVEIEGELISRPYVAMTVAMMRDFGAEMREVDGRYEVSASGYGSKSEYAVEVDASAASYFLALGALAGGPVRVEGLGRDALQGDVAFADALEAMGAQVEWGASSVTVRSPAKGSLQGVVWDCRSIPDAAMTLAPMALCCEGPVELKGIGSWRVKETDRIAAMAAEMTKFGAQVEAGDDWIRVERGQTLRAARVATYKDHRMAMSLSLAACAGVAVEIEDPDCVAKTFPNYFNELNALVASGSTE